MGKECSPDDVSGLNNVNVIAEPYIWGAASICLMHKVIGASFECRAYNVL